MTLTHQLVILLDEAKDYPLDVSQSISISPRQAQQILDNKEKLDKIENILTQKWSMKRSGTLQIILKEILHNDNDLKYIPSDLF